MSPEPELPQGESSTWGVKLAGVLLIIVSLLLEVCLLSYDVHQMGWAFLNPLDAAAAAARPCTNTLGVPGLYLAGLLFCVFGVAAYYVLFLLAVQGMAMLVHSRQGQVVPLVALAVMSICACALADVQPWVLHQWAAGMGLGSPGGYLGYLDGSCVLEAILGVVPSLVLLLVVHAFALIYFSRNTPFLVALECWNLLSCAWSALCSWFARRAEARREARMRRATEWAQRQQAEEQLRQQRMPDEPDDDELDEPNDVPRRIDLPPRRRSTVQPTVRREPEPEPEPDYVPPRPFEEQLERQRENEAARVNLQPPPAGRRRPSPALRQPSGNLLDLLPGDAGLVELEPGIRDNAGAQRRTGGREGMPLNPGVEAAVNRRTGYEPPSPAPTPAPRRPLPTPAPAPRPQPRKDERPQEADYPLPPYDLLSYEPESAEHSEEARREMMDMQQRIIDSLAEFKIPVTAGEITRGPSITRYEFFPPVGFRVNRLTILSKELRLATCSESINILAPVPGKGTVGIELANAVKSPVYLRELLQDPEFLSPKRRIPVALGKDVYGNTVIGDLAAMPHTLVAGTTGSGKSVCINSMIISMLYKFRPEDLRLVLVDPKVVEMQPYKRLPHLACPVVTNPGRVISTLRWAVNEMEHRYKLFSKIGVRNFEDYNRHACEYDPEQDQSLPEEGEVDYRLNELIASEIERQAEDEVPLGEEEQGEFDFDDDNNIPLKLPYVVIIIDELADLMAMVKEDLENYIARLTQKARAAGIHLVVATQTPRSQVVTGTIKANIPSRIAFKVASPLDSRIILDSPGAENLLGKGDFLFLPPGGITRMRRAQGAFVSDEEVAAVVKHCAKYARQNFDQGVISEIERGENGENSDNGGRIAGKGGSDEEDELYTRCVNLVVTERKASTSLLQRRFSIGYGRAAKIMDLMEKRGVIGPNQGASRPREVLVDAP